MPLPQNLTPEQHARLSRFEALKAGNFRSIHLVLMEKNKFAKKRDEIAVLLKKGLTPKQIRTQLKTSTKTIASVAEELQEMKGYVC